MLNPIQTTLNVLPLPLPSVSVAVNLPDAIVPQQPPLALEEHGALAVSSSVEEPLFPESAVPWLIEVHELLTELVHRDTDLHRIPVKENEYKKLLTILEDLMWSVGDDAEDPLIYLFTCVGNFTLRYEDENLPKWEEPWPALETAGSDEEEILPLQPQCAANEPPPGWADEEVALKAFLSMGTLLWQAEKAGNARAAFTTAIRLKPDSAEAYCSRGSVHYAIGNYAAAIQDYAAAIRLAPARVEGYFNRAVTHFQMQDYEAAIRDYSEALAREPDYADAYLGRAHAKLAMHCYEEAMQDYDEAARLTPDNHVVRRYRHLAQVQATNGQP